MAVTKTVRQDQGDVMGIEKSVADDLRGQPLIGKVQNVRIGSAPPLKIDRTCSTCFYRYGPDEANHFPWLEVEEESSHRPDCLITSVEGQKTPQQMFGKKDEFLPEVVDGKPVGNYCPHWLYIGHNVVSR